MLKHEFGIFAEKGAKTQKHMTSPVFT